MIDGAKTPRTRPLPDNPNANTNVPTGDEKYASESRVQRSGRRRRFILLNTTG